MYYQLSSAERLPFLAGVGELYRWVREAVSVH
jgi:hypothetical protein